MTKPVSLAALLSAFALLGAGCAQMPDVAARPIGAVRRLFTPRPATPPRDSAAGPLMQVGASVLASSVALESESRDYSGRSNALRKKVGVLRVAQRQNPDEKVRLAMDAPIDALVEEIDAWQERANQVRMRSVQLDAAARMLLIEGFAGLHGPWISNPAPLVMESVAYKTADAAGLPDKLQGMSIQVTQLVGQAVPDELNVSSFQVSQTRELFGHVEVEPGSEGPRAIPVNEIHQWRLVLSDLEGRPVQSAKIDIVGRMPGHAHGMATQPVVTGELAPGVYRVDGMKFQMHGWWVIDFNVERDGRKDTVRYNMVF